MAGERHRALLKGRGRYSTGRPCKHGHVAERYASTGHCVACIRANRALYVAKYPERVRLSAREAQRRIRRDDPAGVLAYHRHYRATTRERINELQRARRRSRH